MEPGDEVDAPPRGGTAFDQRVPAVIVKRLADRHERDFSDGSVNAFPRYRVRYADGREAEWDDTWVSPRGKAPP
jgi:hypothetical protein